MEQQEANHGLRRILQVDDDEDILLISRLALESYGGFEVRTATGGAEGLALVADWNPQLVILDWMMPGMDGLEFVVELRRRPEGASIPVIFLTASVTEATRRRLLEAGALAVLAKPFDTRAWPTVVLETWIQGARRPGPG